jgi:hypothetical protein
MPYAARGAHPFNASRLDDTFRSGCFFIADLPLENERKRRDAGMRMKTDRRHLRWIDVEIIQKHKRLDEFAHVGRTDEPGDGYMRTSARTVGTRKVNLQVDQSTADALNRVVKESNMVRDAFVNRLIMFLRSSKPLLKHLELPLHVDNYAFRASVPSMPTSPLLAMEEVHADPLFYIRTAIEERYETGLYLLDLPGGLVGFSCYLDDSSVPGTPAYEKAQEPPTMLISLEAFEDNVFSDAQKERSQP